MLSIFNKITKRILDTLFPKQCLFCGAGNVLLCKNCEAVLKINNSSLPDWIETRYSYKDDRIRKIIFKIKYNHTPELGYEMGQYVSPHINTYDSILIPIPISKERLGKRGYNQALYIAKGISNTNTVDALERIKDTQKLFKTKHRDERAEEIKNSFMVKEKYKEFVKNKNIIIVDDVTTTGATLYEARNVLLQSGAASVRAFTLAH
jgi:competence protein ComFC